MPNDPGFFDSPGERARRERFERTRTEVVDFLGPFVVDGLRSAAESTDESLTQLAQTESLFGLGRPTVEPRLRPTPPVPLTPTATPTPEDREIFGLQPPTRIRGIGPGPDVDLGLEDLAAMQAVTEERRRPMGIRENLSGLIRELETEVELFRRFTEPVGRVLGRGAAEVAVPGVPLPLRALGVPDVPGRQRVLGAAETAGAVAVPEVAVPTSLLPIPILDDALRLLAKGVPLAARLLKAEGRTATRAQLRELAEGARRLLTRTTDPSERQLIDEAIEALAVERPIAGAAGEAEQTAAREAAAAPPGPPAQTATGGELPGRGNAGAKQALALKEETLLRPGRVTQLPGIKQVTSGLNPAVSIDRKTLVSYNARQAVTASLETEFAAARQRVVRALQKAWDEEICT